MVVFSGNEFNFQSLSLWRSENRLFLDFMEDWAIPLKYRVNRALPYDLTFRKKCRSHLFPSSLMIHVHRQSKWNFQLTTIIPIHHSSCMFVIYAVGRFSFQFECISSDLSKWSEELCIGKHFLSNRVDKSLRINLWAQFLCFELCMTHEWMSLEVDKFREIKKKPNDHVDLLKLRCGTINLENKLQICIILVISRVFVINEKWEHCKIEKKKRRQPNKCSLQ